MEKIKNYTDAMLDVETLGNEGKFIVTSIALVPFDPSTGETGEPICWNISVSSQIHAGFTVTDSTLAWAERFLSYSWGKSASTRWWSIGYTTG